MFNIEFIGTPKVEFDEPAMRGRITLGEFSEQFVASLSFWSIEDYRKQWRDAAERIVNGEARSCFATCVRKSPDDGVMFIWTAYRIADAVYFQHKLLIPETVVGKFNGLELYEQVEERYTKTEEGEQISEWQIQLGDIIAYLRRLTR